MNTTHLNEFLILANTLSFSRAAEMLFISQSGLSRHMHELETELGTPLLRRTTHEVALTEMGRLLAKEGQQLVDDWDAAQSRLRRHSIPPKGSVRIGIGLEFSYARHLREQFQAFSSRYPDIELIYDVLPGSTPAQTCLTYDIFISPCVFSGLPENVQPRLLRRHGTRLILPPGHPMISRSAVYLHQLAGETIIVPHADELFGPYAQNYLLTEKATKGQVASIKVDNLSTALFLVTMGKGVCLAPRYALNMLPFDSISLTVSDRNCRFDEYLYYNETDNSATQLFYQELPEDVFAIE